MAIMSEEWQRRYNRTVRFDRFGYFQLYTTYWIYRDVFLADRYSLYKGYDHPHDPEGTSPMSLNEKFTDLKTAVDRAKELRIMDLKLELLELENNDQFDF